MIIETKDGKKIKITKPASKNDTPKIVATQFTVNDRDKEIDGLLKGEEKKGKTETIILKATEREPLSTDLTNGVSIPVKDGGKPKILEEKKEHTKE